ncbi:MAG: IS66 family insertion sequence element accessory protein TnpA [Luteolibacter sp.]
MSRPRHTDKQKARILREFEHYDGSAAAFCRQHGVSYQTLMNWRGRASANLPAPEQPPAFLEFQLESSHHWSAPVGPLVELELGGGIILRIHPSCLAQP